MTKSSAATIVETIMAECKLTNKDLREAYFLGAEGALAAASDYVLKDDRALSLSLLTAAAHLATTRDAV